MTYGYMFVMGLTYFFLGEYWYRAFTTDPEVMAYGLVFIKFAAIQQIPLAAAMVLSGALRGAGENRWVMYASFFFGWGMRVPLAFVATDLLGGGVQWAWFTILFDWTLRAFWMYYRFRADKWRLSPRPADRVRPIDAMPPREAST